MANGAPRLRVGNLDLEGRDDLAGSQALVVEDVLGSNESLHSQPAATLRPGGDEFDLATPDGRRVVRSM